MKKAILSSYIQFPGNALEAFSFYSEIFESEPEIRLYQELPEATWEELGRPQGVMHASLDLGNAQLMGSDAFEELVPGNRYYLAWSTPEHADVETVWERFVAHGAKIIMPLEQTFFAERYGILEDRFGVQWMIEQYTANPEAQ